MKQQLTPHFTTLPCPWYYRTALNRLLKRINTYLVRWAQRKYKRLRPFRKALRWWTRLTEKQPGMFAHWAWMPELPPGYG